jgi:F-type H+-transporting ATPase subunit a
MPHISIKAEVLTEILGFPLTNSLLSSWLVVLLFFLIGLYYQRQSRLPSAKRSGLYYLIQAINKGLYGFFNSVIGEKIEIFFPLLASFFLYILFQNFLGLFPGVGSILLGVGEHGEYHNIPILRGGTADLNTTLALGIFSVAASQYYGIKILGFKGYLNKFFNLQNPISLFTGILEVFSEISKIISFSFRLFGNIFAGEVLLVVIAFLIPILASLPFLLLEIFVGFIQALIFTTLTAVFINSAVAKQH